MRIGIRTWFDDQAKRDRWEGFVAVARKAAITGGSEYISLAAMVKTTRAAARSECCSQPAASRMNEYALGLNGGYAGSVRYTAHGESLDSFDSLDVRFRAQRA